MNNSIKAIASIVILTGSMSAVAAPFEFIRIGDIDGFGYDVDTNFGSLTGDGGNADRNGDGHLGVNDVLPSLNGGNTVATGNGDDFDNRWNEGISSVGASDVASSGAEFTDIALSTSYDASSLSGDVYDANTSTFGSGGAFPAPPSSSRPNQPGFVFDFFVADGDMAAGTPIFFNMIFGDYDVLPADIRFTYGSGSTEILAVNAQNNGPDDGLIQGAYAALDFTDVFTHNGSTGWDGYVEVDFFANNEPYTAFDFVELSVEPIQVPSPSTLFLLSLGFVGLVYSRRRS